MHESTPYSLDVAEIALRSDAETLAAAHQLVDLYLTYLREHETDGGLFDVHDLPAPKDAIINAFRVVIATEIRASVRGLMMTAGMTLARFQDEASYARDVRQPLRPGSRKLSWWMKDAKIRRSDRTLRQVGEESARLETIFRHAMTMAEGRSD
jgi:hypothetical protein